MKVVIFIIVGIAPTCMARKSCDDVCVDIPEEHICGYDLIAIGYIRKVDYFRPAYTLEGTYIRNRCLIQERRLLYTKTPCGTTSISSDQQYVVKGTFRNETYKLGREKYKGFIFEACLAKDPEAARRKLLIAVGEANCTATKRNRPTDCKINSREVILRPQRNKNKTNSTSQGPGRNSTSPSALPYQEIKKSLFEILSQVTSLLHFVANAQISTGIITSTSGGNGTLIHQEIQKSVYNILAEVTNLVRLVTGNVTSVARPARPE
ncbi:unnamed protein product [Cylicocyclus nassatus]|uniref:Uncharacterized protein n=1 Tax=Cylicocyclus nassatus TaxID=53992 RepID=A0AA36M5K6_CYLNA|nr:unnamed protein product [Cylicocyclus nassatus]